VTQVPKEIDQLIKSSGNSFHAEVARWFSRNEWHVVVSPYYMDQTQYKAREIDLVAEKAVPITDYFGRSIDDIVIRLFIECKYIASDAVFWLAEKDRDAAQQLVCANGHFKPGNSFTKSHHYLSQSQRVAKLFCSRKSGENDPIYKALNQVLNGMVSMRGQAVSIPEMQKNGRDARFVLEYPVIVCSSFEKVYSVGFDTDLPAQPIMESFQLEVRYAYIDRHEKQHNDYFLLDFVESAKLAEFEKAIDADAGAAIKLLDYG
jgi:hypothetical protein